MEAYWSTIGKLIFGVGGGVFCLLVIGLLAYFACEAWVMFSNRFRDICKAESLIFEYRKNRHDFLIWKNTKDGEG